MTVKPIPPVDSSEGSSRGGEVHSASVDGSFFSMSTITSMSVTVGVGFFKCLSFLIIKSFLLISRCVGKKTSFHYQPPRFEKKNYELSSYDDFLECFEKDPAQGLNTLLDLLEKKPDDFKNIILDAIKETTKPTRREIIVKIEEVYFGILASPEVLCHKDRVVMGDLSNEELFWLTGNDDTWNPKGKAPRVVASRRLQEEYDKTKKEGYNIWKKCFTFIKFFADLDSLKLLNKDCYVGAGQVDINLGDFIERLHYMIGFGVLTSREERFDPLMNGIIQVLGYLNNDTEFDLESFPKFKELVKKAHRLLQKQENQDTLFEIAQAIISLQSPSPRKRKSSPVVRRH